MPERRPQQDAFTPGMLREFLEEFRQGTAAVLAIGNDIGNNKLATEALTRTIRGGDGERGLVTQIALIDSRLQDLDGKVSAMSREGTPGNQREIKNLEILGKANQDGLASVIARVVALEAEAKQGLHGEINRGWWLAGQAVTVLLAVVAMAVSVGVAVFHK